MERAKLRIQGFKVRKILSVHLLLFRPSGFCATSALLVLEYYVDVEEGVGVWEWELVVVEKLGVGIGV